MNLKVRKRQGEEIVTKLQASEKNDRYQTAVDAISSILLAVAQNGLEATQLLHAAEVEFRNLAEAESFVSEG